MSPGREPMEQIRWAQQKGLKVYGETCPQYIALTADDLKGLNMDETGGKYVCSPPPRDHAAGRRSGRGIDAAASSRRSRPTTARSFTKARQGKLNPQGAQSFQWVPNGIPGVETRLANPVFEGRRRRAGSPPTSSSRSPPPTTRRCMGSIPKKGSIGVGLRRRHRAVGSGAEGEHPAGDHAPRLRLHAVRGPRRHRLARHDNSPRQAHDEEGAHPRRTRRRELSKVRAVTLCHASARMKGILWTSPRSNGLRT